MNKTFKRSVIAAATVALLASGVGIANAGNVPAAKAQVGLDCSSTQVGKVSKGTGVNGSDLTCTKVTTGTFAGQTKWWYAGLKPLGSFEFVSSSAIGGGYGTTAIALGDALKKEEVLKDYTVTYRTNAALGLGYFTDQKGRTDLGAITGFAMPGSVTDHRLQGSC